MISSDYIVGLTDGEGCFYVNIRPPDKRYKRSKHGVETHFYIKMREDELPLLEEIKKFFKCGAIYYQRDKRPNHASCYRFEINSQYDIHQVLIPFFDNNPLKSLKSNDYSIFREIAMMVKNKNHRTEKGIKKIRQLKSKMNLGARPVREIRSPGGNEQ
jgi:hypothetical protein